MRITPTHFEEYLQSGCGRCALGGTPDCKVHSWTDILLCLREWVTEAGLKEEIKWSMPTYTLGGKNVLMISAFKDFASINFFKGILLPDPAQLLESPGENSQSARYLKVRNLPDLLERKAAVMALIHAAMEVEKSGARVEFKKPEEYEIPAEFQLRLDSFPDLKTAFQNLSPGRQRGYLLHFSQPKQSATRESRIEKCIPKILAGKGMMDN